MKTIKCLWCGGTFELTRKGRPKQHRYGKTTCLGSGQLASTHQLLRKIAASNKDQPCKN